MQRANLHPQQSAVMVFCWGDQKQKFSATNNSEEIAHKLNVKVRQQRKQNKTGRGLTESEVALVVSRTKAVVEIKSFILSILVSSTG